jgi:hypothetical protein
VLALFKAAQGGSIIEDPVRSPYGLLHAYGGRFEVRGGRVLRICATGGTTKDADGDGQGQTISSLWEQLRASSRLEDRQASPEDPLPHGTGYSAIGT